MGRIKTQKVKSVGNDIHEKFGSKFSGDFDQNKKAVQQVAEVRSKKLRNILAGYLTHKAKKRA